MLEAEQSLLYRDLKIAYRLCLTALNVCQGVVNTTLRNITFMVLLTEVISLLDLHVRRWVDKHRGGYVDYRNCPRDV